MSNDEIQISLRDIFSFLLRYKRIILVCGFIGLGVAISQLIFLKAKYQVLAIVAIAQIDAAQNNNLNFLGINIEEPNALIARISLKGSIPTMIAEECNSIKVDDNQVVRFSIPKNFNNAIAINVVGSSAQGAENCADALYKFIKESQDKIIAPYIQEAENRLYDARERLAALKQILSRSGVGNETGALYLSIRDEYKILLNEVSALTSAIRSNQKRSTRLISEVTAEKIPLSPNAFIRVIGGLMLGLFFGLFISFALQLMNFLKKQ